MKSAVITNNKTIATFCFLAFVYCFWILAWLLKLFLDTQNFWIKSDEGSFVYWIFPKLLVWIIPSVIFIRLIGKSFQEVLGFQNLRRTIFYGGGIGALLVLINILAKLFIFHKPLILDRSLFPFLSAVLIAPFVEEITFRGAVLNGLLAGYSPKMSNFLCAVFFLGIHLPGWYFRGELVNQLYSNVAISIFILGLIFGYIALKSNSIIGSVIAHFLNNLTS